MRKVLKEAREDADLTQRQIAELLGISVRHYQRIESGRSNGSFEIWDDLEDILWVNQRKLREDWLDEDFK